MSPDHCEITAHLGEGRLQVELLDANEKLIAVFAWNDCARSKSDHACLQGTWTADSVATSKAFKARFHLKGAFVYGFLLALLSRMTLFLEEH